MSTTFTRTCIAAAFCAVALTTQPSAWSAETSAVASMEQRAPFPFTYRFNADDLASAAGAERVYLDLEKKARRACTIGAAPASHIQRVDHKCAEELTANVVRRIGSRTLTAQLGNHR